MALTLPVEEMSRLQVSFKLALPDGRMTFEMSSSGPSPQFPPILNGLKLHFQGFRDDTGLSLKVWASGLEEPDVPLAIAGSTPQAASTAIQVPPSHPSPSTAIEPLEDSSRPSPAPPSSSQLAATPPTSCLPELSCAPDAQVPPVFGDQYTDSVTNIFQWQPVDPSTALSTDFSYLDAFDLGNVNWPQYQPGE
ncbi:hypothetical protein BDN72DRAFT_843270 [Pluteus cervinus]|uniref:Uncharacterized protein n=1 Tax=Pluteus cervinus TaxID=181527 RepID=A0ACD3ANP3_9AGAR|nr:hypothetical protein BDN72DRAFT_843270 [Pluteus cervinus]